jgi:hypothetical protein
VAELKAAVSNKGTADDMGMGMDMDMGVSNAEAPSGSPAIDADAGADSTRKVKTCTVAHQMSLRACSRPNFM